MYIGELNALDIIHQSIKTVDVIAKVYSRLRWGDDEQFSFYDDDGLRIQSFTPIYLMGLVRDQTAQDISLIIAPHEIL